MSDDFRLTVADFSGPLDLLLYLVRKHEIDILNVSIAVVLEQYLVYLDVLKEIDINGVGDFLAMATLLIEIKSQEMLPGEEVIEADIDDPRQELVQHLLAYKEYYDSASELERRSRLWQQHYPRVANDLPRRSPNVAEAPIAEVELWDLVSAFGRLIREASPMRAHQVVYDDTPISKHMTNIYTQLKENGKLGLRDLFTAGQHKSTMIGIFLALLELVRHEYAMVQQDRIFGEIELTLRDGTKPLEFAGMGEANS
ncbi:MAG: segregation and condensation protein A [Thermoguttaceae bacterium]